MKRDPAAQYRALQEGCGLWPNSARALLLVTGEDRVRLLNGLVTCEVKDVRLGKGVRGFFTDVKGHILADVVIRASEHGLWLELPASNVSAVAAHIEKYIVVDRVEVQVADDREALTLAGPITATMLAPVLDIPQVPTSPWRYLETVLRGEVILVAADGRFGVPAVTLWASPSAIAAIRQDLLATKAPTGLAEVDDDAIEIVRVEEGIPRFGIDFDAGNLPQETGLEDSVSYSKGCYLGQEVVARLHFRGQAARRLCRLLSSSEEPPPAGSRLFLDERQAGTVTSAVRSPIGDRVSALAILQRRAAEEGTELLLEDGGSMRVV